MDLVIHNLPSELHTYHREGIGESNIDVTLSTPEVSNRIIRCKVSDLTDSDHRVLSFDLYHKRTPNQESEPKVRYAVGKANWPEFCKKLRIELNNSKTHFGGTYQEAANALEEAINKAASASIPTRKDKGRLRSVWWNDDLTSSKRRLNSFKSTRNWKGEDKQEYNILRNSYLALIKKSKAKSWKD